MPKHKLRRRDALRMAAAPCCRGLLSFALKPNRSSFTGARTPRAGVSSETGIAKAFMFRAWMPALASSPRRNWRPRAPTPHNPSWLALHPNRRYLYAVNERMGTDGKVLPGEASAFSIDPENGQAELPEPHAVARRATVPHCGRRCRTDGVRRQLVHGQHRRVPDRPERRIGRIDCVFRASRAAVGRARVGPGAGPVPLGRGNAGQPFSALHRHRPEQGLCVSVEPSKAAFTPHNPPYSGLQKLPIPGISPCIPTRSGRTSRMKSALALHAAAVRRRARGADRRARRCQRTGRLPGARFACGMRRAPLRAICLRVEPWTQLDRRFSSRSARRRADAGAVLSAGRRDSSQFRDRSHRIVPDRHDAAIGDDCAVAD